MDRGPRSRPAWSAVGESGAESINGALGGEMSLLDRHGEVNRGGAPVRMGTIYEPFIEAARAFSEVS